MSEGYNIQPNGSPGRHYAPVVEFNIVAGADKATPFPRRSAPTTLSLMALETIVCPLASEGKHCVALSTSDSIYRNDLFNIPYFKPSHLTPLQEEPVMNNDRRTYEALSFRMFFDDQLQHLQKLIGNLKSHIYDEEQQTEEDEQIVENFVNISNSKMRAVDDYSDKLRVHVRALYNHVLHIAGQIPPPIGLDMDTFKTNPLINALFVNSKDIDKLFENDGDVSAYLRSHSKYQVPVMYALLTAGKNEKRILGVGMQGETLIREVPQQTVNFFSHKIHVPCASSAELNTTLKEYLFSRVVALVKQEMASHMTNQLFKTSDDSYESRVNSLANPDIYLNTLIKYLETPSNLLSINKTHFKLSKLGIKLDDDKQSSNEFDIHELTWSNDTRNVVLRIAHAR